MADYNVNDIYTGNPSSLDPGYGNVFTGYRVPASKLGAPTKADEVNQLSQVNMLLNQGIIPIEVGVIKPEIFESIPKEMFKEINRKAKLSGAKISVHAPVIGMEPSGISKYGYDESERKLVENQFKAVIDRTASMNEDGGMSITVHSSAGLPGGGYEMTPEGKKEKQIFVINKETGKMSLLKEEERYLPRGLGEKSILKPRDELKNLNQTEWDNTLSQMVHYKHDADELIRKNEAAIMDVIPLLQKKELTFNDLNHEQKTAYSRLLNAQTYLKDTELTMNSMFNKAWKFGTDEDRAKLKKTAEEYKKSLEKNKTITGHSNAIQEMIINLNQIQPQIYTTVEDFAVDKTAKTFANVALHGLLKYQDKAPVINIENMFGAEYAFSMGKELETLIKKTKEEFVNAAVSKGISESKAKQKADELIGVTLDVGHLNIAKKKGFTDKDLLKEIEPIAKYVKHVHLTDNFGSEDSHLAPGMGNVPFKEILEQLGKAGYKGTKIVEAAPGGVQLLGAKTFSHILEAMGSPVFAGGADTPYWNQAPALQQSYSGGFGQMLPQTNYETFGGGFTNIPMELGGAKPAVKGSRFSGDAME